MPTPYDQFNKYLTKAQKNKLVQAQARFSNQNADERVEVQQQNQGNLTQYRNFLANRGLSSAKGTMVSGEEARFRAQQAQFTGAFNNQLKAQEDAATTNLAANFAAQTKAARARAAQQAELARINDSIRTSTINYNNFVDDMSHMWEQEARMQPDKRDARNYLGITKDVGGKTYTDTTGKTHAIGTPYNENAARMNGEFARLTDAQKEQAYTSTLSPDQKKQYATERLQNLLSGMNQGIKAFNDAQADYFDRVGYDANAAMRDAGVILQESAKLKASLADIEAERKAIEQAGLGSITMEDQERWQNLRSQEEQLKKQISGNDEKLETIFATDNVYKAAFDDMMESASAGSSRLSRYANVSDEDLDMMISDAENAITDYYRNVQYDPLSGTGIAAPAAEYNKLNELKNVKAYRQQQQIYAKQEEANAAGANNSVQHKYTGKPEDYDFANKTSSKYYTAVNDNEVLSFMVGEAAKAKAKVEGQAEFNASTEPLTETEFNAYSHRNDDAMYYSEYASFMSEAEKNTFNYIYNNEGGAKADEYFESIFASLAQKGADRVSIEARKFVAENGAIGASLASIPMNFVGAAMGAAENVRNAIHGREVNKYTAYKNNFAQSIRDTVSKDYSGAGKFLYGTFMSMGDSAVAALMGGAGGAMLGLSAYNSALADGLDRGLDAKHAQATAVMAGICEMFFEKYSLEGIKGLAAHEASNWKEVLVNIAKQQLTEGSEEVATDIGNALADYLINGSASEFSQNVRAYMDDGLSESEARTRAAGEFGVNLLMSYAGGALSGGIMGGGASFAGYAFRGGKQAAAYGKAVRNDKATYDRIASHEFKNEETAKFVEEQGGIENLSDAELGRVAGEAMMEENAEAAVKAVNESAGGLEALKQFDFQDKQAQELAKKENLTDNEVAYLFATQQQERLSDVASKLAATGNNSNAVYTQFEKIVTGQKIDREGAEAIAASGEGAAIFTEMFGGDGSVDSILETGNVQAVKNEKQFGKANFIGDTALDRGASRTARSMFRNAADVVADSKTQTFETKRGSVAMEMKNRDTRYLSNSEKAAVRVATAVANAFGVNVRFVDTFVGENGYKNLNETPRGQYDSATRTITVALDSDQALSYVIGHELTHHLKTVAKDAYKNYKKVVMDHINEMSFENSGLDEKTVAVLNGIKAEMPGKSNWDVMLEYENRRHKGENLSPEGLEDEVLAEVGSDMLEEPVVQEELAKKQGVVQQISEFMSKLANSILEILDIKSSDITSAETKLISGELDRLQDISKAYAELVKTAEVNDTVREKAEDIAKSSTKEEVKRSENITGKTDAVLDVARSITENYKGFNLNKLSGQIAAAYRLAVTGNFEEAMAEVRKIANEVAHNAKMKNISVNAERYDALRDALREAKNAYVDIADRADAGYKVGSIKAFNNAMMAAGINFKLVTNEDTKRNKQVSKLEDVYRALTEQGMYGESNQFADILPADINVKDMAQTILDAVQNLKPDEKLLPAYQVLNTTEQEFADSIAEDIAVGFAEIQFSVRDHNYMELATKDSLNPMEERLLREMVDERAAEAGFKVRAFHGTSRGDRVGNRFRKDRATSGPMAYFTDNKGIAESYSRDKVDTSLMRVDERDLFTIKLADGTEKKLQWKNLPQNVRTKLTLNAKHVTLDDEAENIIFDKNAKNGLGDYSYELRDKGNPLDALYEGWINGGTLYREEGRFIDVLRAAGVTEEMLGITYDDPRIKAPKVYDVYLAINNPFVVSENFNEEFISGLRQYIDETGYQDPDMRNVSLSDGWDKNHWKINDWIERAEGEIKDGQSGVWTSIPDIVTQYLESKGYDGIKDKGGKFNETEHTVWIPFSEEQVKSAELVTKDDSGNVIPLEDRFNKESNDIRYSVRDSAYMDLAKDLEAGKDTMWNSVELAEMLEDAAEKAGAYKGSYGQVQMFHHGTDVDFNTFKSGRNANGKNWGMGHYLTPTQTVAEDYAKGKRVVSAFVFAQKFATNEDHSISESGKEAFNSMVANVVNALGISFDQLYDAEAMRKQYREEYRKQWDRLDKRLQNEKAMERDVESRIAHNINEWVSQNIKMQTSYNNDDASILREASSDIGNAINAAGVSFDMDAYLQAFSDAVSNAYGYQGIAPNGTDIGNKEIVIWDNRLVKEANLIEHDDNGNIIPLSQRFNKESNDIRYSVRSNEKNAFNPEGLTLHDQLQDSFDSAESFDGRYVYVGEFEGWFLKALRKYVKVESLPIVMNYRDAYLAMHTKETGKYHGDGINYHSLGVTGLQNALESIDRTNVVMISKKGPEKIEIALDTVDEKNNRCLSILAVNTTAQSSDSFLATHVVTSVYGKRNIDRYIQKSEEDGRTIKIEAPASVIPQVQYEGDMVTGASDGIISEESEDVKQNSVRDNLSSIPDQFEKVWSEKSDEDKAAIIRAMKNKALLQLNSPERVFDLVAGKNDTIRQLLYDVLEKPFNEAGGNFAHGVKRQYKEFNDGLKACFGGRMPTLKESAMIQRFGEGSYQHECKVTALPGRHSDGRYLNGSWDVTVIESDGTERKYHFTDRELTKAFQGDADKVRDIAMKTYNGAVNNGIDPEKAQFSSVDVHHAPYTKEMLMDENPEHYEKIIAAERLHREIYDNYVDSINAMLNDIYPFVLEKDIKKESELTEIIDDIEEKSNVTVQVYQWYQKQRQMLINELNHLEKEFPEDVVETRKQATKLKQDYEAANDKLIKLRQQYYDLMQQKTDLINELNYMERYNSTGNTANIKQMISDANNSIRKLESEIKTREVAVNNIAWLAERAEYRHKHVRGNNTQAKAQIESDIRRMTNIINNTNNKLIQIQAKKAEAIATRERFREERANGSTVRNKRLLKRDDYFHHFNQMTEGAIGSIKQLFATNNEISPALAGISENTKPNTKWTDFLQRRLGSKYTEDAVNGMYQYIIGAETILAYDPVIKRIRDVRRAMTDTATEIENSNNPEGNQNANNFLVWLDQWGNSIAGKSHKWDRAFAEGIGTRKVMQILGALNGIVKKSKLLFNFRSALVQVSNLTNALGYMGVDDWKNGMLNYANSFKNEELRTIIGQSNFLSQRTLDTHMELKEETVLGALKDKPMAFAEWMLSAGDNFSSQLTWWAAYNQYARLKEQGEKEGKDLLREKGYRQYESAVDYADDITRRTHGGRGVGEVPLVLQSKIVNTFAPFQVEVLNTYENLMQQIGKKNALGIVGMEMGIFAINMVTRALFGDGVLGFDFIHALIAIIKNAIAPEDEDADAIDRIEYGMQQLTGELIGGVPFAAQLASTLIPDEDARKWLFGEDQDPTRYGTGTLGLSSISDLIKLVPDSVTVIKNAAQGNANRDMIEYQLTKALDATIGNYMTGGTQLMRTAKGVSTWAKGYSANKNGRIQYTVDQDAGELLQMVLFGKWAVPEGREYLGNLDPIADIATEKNNFRLLSDSQTDKYKGWVKAGGDGKLFFKITKQFSQLTAKDENGETVSGLKKERAAKLLDSYKLTDEQRQFMWETVFNYH